jgi:hypothetical protein
MVHGVSRTSARESDNMELVFFIGAFALLAALTAH